VVAYFYFDYRNQETQSAENVISSILRQIALGKSELPHSVAELYRKLKGQRRPQQQELEQTVQKLCADFDRVFILIHALDECDANNHRNSVLGFLETLRSSSSVSIFVTSRPHLKDTTMIYETSSKVLIEAENSDLRRYVSQEIESSDAVEEIDIAFEEDIIKKFVAGAHRMYVKSPMCLIIFNWSSSRSFIPCFRELILKVPRFLLVVLQVQAILSETSVGEVEEALDIMPSGLNDAVEETLQRIQKQPEKRRTLGMNTLMWISHSKRPLRVAELSEALSIRPGESYLNPKFRKRQGLMLACCMGLVIVDKESSVIRLVHYSVQEYFSEHHSRIFPFGKQSIAEHLVMYLMSDAFALGSSEDESEILTLIGRHPFATYATRNWGDHVLDATSKM